LYEDISDRIDWIWMNGYLLLSWYLDLNINQSKKL